MSDTAEAGSVVETPAGTPAQPIVEAANGSAAKTENPFSGLSEGTRKWVETKGYNDMEALASAGMHAETKLGSAVHVPASDAPKEEWDKFYSRLPEQMRPINDPAKIEFKRPENLPENLPYDEGLASTSRNWMAEANLTGPQAQAMHDKFAGYMAEQATMRQAQIAQSVEDAHDALVKEWGPQESEGFKTKHELANRAIKKLDLVDAYKEAGLLLPDGALTNPTIAKAFAAIGESMFKEDTIETGGVANGPNPFQSGNLTEISALVKNDPEHARRLAKAAGVDPRPYFSANPL